MLAVEQPTDEVREATITMQPNHTATTSNQTYNPGNHDARVIVVRSVTTPPGFWRSGKGRALVFFVATICSVVAQCIPLHAQDKDVGKDIVKGLLRALVESQLERQAPRGGVAPPPDQLRPGRPGGGRPGPGQAGVQMQQLRPIIASISQEVTTLTALLNTDARRSFEIRRLLGDALRLQATTASLKQRVDREQDPSVVIQGILTLNAEWKTLSHQLMQCASLSPQSSQCIERINRLDAQYCAILGIQEQFDSRDLVRAADTLAADVRALTDELNYSTGVSANRYRLIASLRRIEERAHLLANLASDAVPFQSVVSEYKGLFQSWQAVRTELAAFNGRSVTRAVARIEETHRNIHQLLRLDYGVDPALTSQMVVQLQRDVAVLFRSITLEQMMVLRDHRAIAVGADVMSGSVENLVDVISRNENRQVIGEAWFFVDEAWRVLGHYLSPIKTPEVQRQLAGISQSIDALRQAIGVQVEFDPKLIAQQAASLSGTADRIHTALKSWMSRPGVSLAALHADVDRLEDKCHELETLCANPREQARALARCDETISIWQTVRPQLLQCTTEERDTLERLSDTLTQDIVRLRMMLSE